MATRPTIVPCLRYRDASAAIVWLERAFGFQSQMIVPGPDGTIAHAQLVRGTAMIMLGSVTDTEFGRFTRQPEEVGGNTQSAYLIVSDADAVYASALAAGARIAIDIKDEDYGGRGFSCLDPEGFLWSVGTYDPWAERA